MLGETTVGTVVSFLIITPLGYFEAECKKRLKSHISDVPLSSKLCVIS